MKALLFGSGLIVLAHVIGFIAASVVAFVKGDHKDRHDRMTLLAFAGIVGFLSAATFR